MRPSPQPTTQDAATWITALTDDRINTIEVSESRGVTPGDSDLLPFRFAISSPLGTSYDCAGAKSADCRDDDTGDFPCHKGVWHVGRHVQDRTAAEFICAPVDREFHGAVDNLHQNRMR